MMRFSVWDWMSSPLLLSGLLMYQPDVLALKSPPRIRLGVFDRRCNWGEKWSGTCSEVWGGMYMFTMVVCLVFPVLMFMACISVVVSLCGSRDLMCVSADVYVIDLCTRVMSPPPLPPALSCRMTV